MHHPLRSGDRLNDDHMTAEVHRRWGEIVPLAADHGRFFIFNFDGFSHFSLQPNLQLYFSTGSLLVQQVVV